MQVTDEMVRVALEKFWEAWPWFRDTYTELKNERGNPLTLSDLPPEPMEAAITAALAAMWQPIETAPRDGKDIILYFPLIGLSDDWPKVIIGHKRAIDHARGHWVWQSRAFRGYSDEYQPTHWMPIPPAPSQLSKRDDAEDHSTHEA